MGTMGIMGAMGLVDGGRGGLRRAGWGRAVRDVWGGN